jgi:tRNA dimethylallyltransferase
MIQDGLIEEVQNLYKEFSINSQAFKGIGYKEFIPYFENNITLDEVKETIKMNTRRYAKRQLTWFRKTPNVNWYDKSIYSEEDIIKDIISKFNS